MTDNVVKLPEARAPDQQKRDPSDGARNPEADREAEARARRAPALATDGRRQLDVAADPMTRRMGRHEARADQRATVV
jgi:hypothetical protein